MTGSFVGIVLLIALLGLSSGYRLLQIKHITWFFPIAALLFVHWIQSGIQIHQFPTNWVETDYQDWIQQGLLALNLMIRNPLVGVGYGQMEAYIQWINPDVVLTPSMIDASVFSLFGETGLLGGLAFIGMFFVLFRALLSSPEIKKEECSLNKAAQVSCLILGMAGFLYEVHVHLFTWCWLGVLYGAFSCKDRNDPNALNAENTQP